VSSSVPHLSPAQLRAALDVRDLSDPAQGPHAIQILTDRAVAALSRAWSCEVRWCRGAKIVPVADNLGKLRFTVDALERGGWTIDRVAMAHRGGAAKERSAAAPRQAPQYAQRTYPRAAPNSYYPGTYQQYYSYQPYRYGY